MVSYRLRVAIAICTALVVVLKLPLVASAAHADWSRDYYGQRIRHNTVDLRQAESTLKAKDAAEWTEREAEEYLFRAMFNIFYALKMYVDINERHPASWEDLRSSGVISEQDWPGNPYRAWEPMSWTTNPAEFSAGDLILQICPPEYYSGLVAPVAKSFTIGVFGPSVDYRPISPPDKLLDWSVVPDGVVFITAARFSTTAEQKAKREAAEKKRAEQEKAEEGSGNELQR